MKEFLKSKTVTYNLMSFTGYKALILFSLLSEGPKSYDEICNYFYNHPYLREKFSIDTLRVYINSLRMVGCNVKRIRDENKVSKYVILNHPFELKFTKEQLQILLKVCKNLAKNIEVEDILHLVELFKKLSIYISDENFIFNLKKVFMLNDVDSQILKTLVDCCKNKNQIVITYNSPNSGNKQIELITNKLVVKNNKIYLLGTGFEYKQFGEFLLSRITNIDEIKFKKTIKEDNIKKVLIKYQLDFKDVTLDTNERILEDLSDKIIVECETSNEFLLIQKLLEYGPHCKILAPLDFKEKFINVLKEMKAGYCCE